MSEETIVALQKEIETLKKENAELKQQNHELKQEIDELEMDIVVAEDKNEDMRAGLQTLKAKLHKDRT